MPVAQIGQNQNMSFILERNDQYFQIQQFAQTKTTVTSNLVWHGLELLTVMADRNR